MEVPQETKNRATIWSSNPTHGNTPGQNRNSKIHTHPMLTVALFTVAKTWRQPRCPSDECTKRCMYTMAYSSAIRKNEVMPSAAKRMQTEIIWSEVNQKEKKIPHAITFMWNLKYGTDPSMEQIQNHRHREETGSCQGGGRCWGDGMEASRSNLLYIEWINNKVLL